MIELIKTDSFKYQEIPPEIQIIVDGIKMDQFARSKTFRYNVYFKTDSSLYYKIYINTKTRQIGLFNHEII